MYLKPLQVEPLKLYRYKGVNTSFYNYILSPFHTRLVECLPLWLAPNLISTLSFAFSMAGFSMVAYYDPDFSLNKETHVAPVPQWVWLAVAFCVFTYYTLDGCDGIQARRTGTSSPLGELFDHGFDAWNGLLHVSTVIALFGMHEVQLFIITAFYAYLILVVFSFTFFLIYWEKYVTGVVNLPLGMDSGLLALILMYLLAGFFGPFALQENILGYFSVKDFLRLLIKFIPFTSFFGSCYTIYCCSKRGCKISKMKMFVPLISPIVAFIFLTAWAYFSPSNILQLHPRWFFLLTSVVACDISIDLIVNQMVDSTCPPIKMTVVACSLASIFALLPHEMNMEIVTLKFITSVLVLAHLHFVCSVGKQMSDVLGISIFRIPFNVRLQT
ncbi:ethanolaminephosphotransferase 1-like isoform X1 [Ciona intestinalis]